MSNEARCNREDYVYSISLYNQERQAHLEETMAVTHDDAKPERLDLRIDSDRKELLRRAAALRRQSLTDFVISSAEKGAAITLREQQTMTLSAGDSVAFVESLLNPPEPNDALRAAAQRYRTFIGE
jgi:uncharacterized protein (DUF1778 family)